MNKKQSEVMQFLLKFDCCKEEQLINFLDCSKEDIAYLLNEKLIIKKDDLIYSKIKEKVFDIRYCIAIEVLCLYKDKIQSLKKGKYPVLVEFVVDGISCDVIVAKNIEQESIFKDLYKISNADSIIIILENPTYNKENIKTKKQCLICKYPLEIIDKLN